MLIKLKSEATTTDRTVLRSELQADLLHTFASGAESWKLPASLSVESAIQLLQDDELVEYIEPDWHIRLAATLPADTLFPQQWSMYNTGQPAGCDPNYSGGGTPGVDIDATLAWDVSVGISDPNQRPIIAVIDTGIDYNHPDLAANMWVNIGEIPGNNQDDDENQHIDDIYGYDFWGDAQDEDGDPYSNAQVHQGHGTHVAGIAGAVGKYDTPSEGIAGVNWKVRIMALKIYKSGDVPLNQNATVSDAVQAIDYARLMGADVINASWSIDPNCSSPCSRTVEDAIRDAGRSEILFVAVAGNSSMDLDSNNPVFPASYTLDSIISVTTTDYQDNQLNGWGVVSVDLGAPGDGICSTTPTKDCVWNDCGEEPCDPRYNCSDANSIYMGNTGTSMAAPHVAGVAALLRAVKPGIPALSIKARILNNVDPNIASLVGKTVTGGRLNAYKAIYPQESVAPNAVTDLTRQNSPPQGVTLTWTAPSDGEGSEQVIFYDLRYSTSAITSQNFGSATRFWDVAKPLAPGQSQTTTVTGLTAYTTWYFVLRSVDDWGNPSSLSNSVSAQTCNQCTASFCRPWGDDLYQRCTFSSSCGAEGCCLYTCVIDSTCTEADPCPSHACSSACS